MIAVMRLVTRMKVLRTVQASLLLGGGAWLLASGEVGLAIGLVAGALLHASLDLYTWLVGKRELSGPARTECVRRIAAAVPEDWSTHGDDTGLHVTDGDTTITVAWHETGSTEFGRAADLERIATGLLAAYAQGRTAHDHEPCLTRLLGDDVRGRRAVFAGLELTIVEAYAVRVPVRSAIVTALAVRREAVPEALIRRYLESIRLTAAGARGDQDLKISVRPRRSDQSRDDPS